MLQSLFVTFALGGRVSDRCSQCLQAPAQPWAGLVWQNSLNCPFGLNALVGPPDHELLLPDGIRCCATQFGAQIAECEADSCAQNFGGFDLTCSNHGDDVETTVIGEKHEHCPYPRSDRAICDVSYYVSQNGGQNCRQISKGNCLGKVKCNTDGVVVVSGQSSNGTANGGGGPCVSSSWGFNAGEDCFYIGMTEDWKVCTHSQQQRLPRMLLAATKPPTNTVDAKNTSAKNALSGSRPTKLPSKTPTKKPTRWPTARPSKKIPATDLLTNKATKKPTRALTIKPTKRPTTRKPSAARSTRKPTRVPSPRTTRPSMRPTVPFGASDPEGEALFGWPWWWPLAFRRKTKPTTRKPTKRPSLKPTAPTTRAPSQPLTQSPTSLFPTQALTSRPTTTSPTPNFPATSQSPTSQSLTSISPTTSSPISASPTTKSPTFSTLTPLPSESPTSASPTTTAPTSKSLTSSPTTISPTSTSPTTSPTTSSPSKSPTSISPTTISPTSRSPTISPTSRSPTVSPTSGSPTTSPTSRSPTISPTISPTSRSPTISPITSPTSRSPTTSPTSRSPTISPTSRSPTISPTFSPTSRSPTISPTTKSPTSSPTSKSPTTISPTRSPIATSATACSSSPAVYNPVCGPTPSITDCNNPASVSSNAGSFLRGINTATGQSAGTGVFINNNQDGAACCQSCQNVATCFAWQVVEFLGCYHITSAVCDGKTFSVTSQGFADNYGTGAAAACFA